MGLAHPGEGQRPGQRPHPDHAQHEPHRLRSPAEDFVHEHRQQVPEGHGQDGRAEDEKKKEEHGPVPAGVAEPFLHIGKDRGGRLGVGLAHRGQERGENEGRGGEAGDDEIGGVRP